MKERDELGIRNTLLSSLTVSQTKIREWGKKGKGSWASKNFGIRLHYRTQKFREEKRERNEVWNLEKITRKREKADEVRTWKNFGFLLDLGTAKNSREGVGEAERRS